MAGVPRTIAEHAPDDVAAESEREQSPDLMANTAAAFARTLTLRVAQKAHPNAAYSQSNPAPPSRQVFFLNGHSFVSSLPFTCFVPILTHRLSFQPTAFSMPPLEELSQPDPAAVLRAKLMTALGRAGKQYAPKTLAQQVRMHYQSFV